MRNIKKLRRGTIRSRTFLNNEQIDSSFVSNVTFGDSLTTVIKNDFLYGVGSRPTLPSCFEDEDELKQEGVDPLSDMRHDSWHDVSVAMNPTFQRTEQIIEVGSGGNDPEPTDPPTNE